MVGRNSWPAFETAWPEFEPSFGFYADRESGIYNVDIVRPPNQALFRLAEIYDQAGDLPRLADTTVNDGTSVQTVEFFELVGAFSATIRKLRGRPAPHEVRVAAQLVGRVEMRDGWRFFFHPDWTGIPVVAVIRQLWIASTYLDEEALENSGRSD